MKDTSLPPSPAFVLHPHHERHFPSSFTHFCPSPLYQQHCKYIFQLAPHYPLTPDKNRQNPDRDSHPPALYNKNKNRVWQTSGPYNYIPHEGRLTLLQQSKKVTIQLFGQSGGRLLLFISDWDKGPVPASHSNGGTYAQFHKTT